MAQTPDDDRAGRFVPVLTAARNRVYAYILTLLPDRTEADDVMQETSLVLWRRFDEFQPAGADPREAFVRWGCGIAYNQVRTHARRRQRHGLLFSEDLMRRIADTRERDTELLERRRRALDDCLRKLRQADGELVERCYAGPHSFKEAAQQLNRPVNTVYKAINRIRRALYDCIQRALEGEGTL